MKKDLIILLSFHAITSFRLQRYEYKSNKYSFFAKKLGSLRNLMCLCIEKKQYDDGTKDWR